MRLLFICIFIYLLLPSFWKWILTWVVHAVSLSRRGTIPHCVKSARKVFFWSVFSRVWTEYGKIIRISPYSVWKCGKYKCGKIQTRLTQNTDTFYAVPDTNILLFSNLQDTVTSITLSPISTVLLSYLKSFVPQFNKIYFGVFDIAGCPYDSCH